MNRRRGSAYLSGVLGAATAAVALLAPAPAGAQSRYFYLDRAQISGAPEDGFTVFRPHVEPGTRLYGSLAVGYAHGTLRADTVTDDPIAADRIENPMQGQLMSYASVGAQWLGRLTASATFPLALYNNTGADPAGEDIGSGGLSDNPVAAHDLRVDLRVRSFDSSDGVASFGGGLAGWFPTGNPDGFGSDDQFTWMLYGAAEFDFEDFFLAGHIGPHFRPERSIGGANGALFIGSELRWALGAYLPMREGLVRLGGELHGSTGLDSSAGPDEENTIFGARNTSLEWLGQLRFVVEQARDVVVNAGLGTRLSTGYGAPDFRVLFSVGGKLELTEPDQGKTPAKVVIVPKASDYDRDTDGDGFPDAADICPTVKEDKKPPLTSDGCPWDVDRDHDGIIDAKDLCISRAEDHDGVNDEDGCPEQDVDGDGIDDPDDRCPMVPGLRSLIPEKMGCPSEDRDQDGIKNDEDACPDAPGPRSQNPERNGCSGFTRVTEEGEIKLFEPIQFETGKSEIKRESNPILDEIVGLMKGRPELKVGVYGHTDNRGGAEMNLRLSKGRAAACMQYLIDNGIEQNRVLSEGYGAEKPVADNKTEEGRARNRRVEFKILSGAPGAEEKGTGTEGQAPAAPAAPAAPPKDASP